MKSYISDYDGEEEFIIDTRKGTYQNELINFLFCLNIYCYITDYIVIQSDCENIMINKSFIIDDKRTLKFYMSYSNYKCTTRFLYILLIYV